MWQFIIKAIIAGIVVACVSTLAKTRVVGAGLLGAMPIVSLLSICFLYFESNRNSERVASLSSSIGWLVFPTAVFLLLFSALLRRHFQIYLAFALSALAMMLLDLLVLKILRKI